MMATQIRKPSGSNPNTNSYMHSHVEEINDKECSDDDSHCPLCMEELDYSDINFKPCYCGYQVCRFCWNHIRESLNGKCPACRRDYTDEIVAANSVPQADRRINYKTNKKKTTKNTTADYSSPAAQMERERRQASSSSAAAAYNNSLISSSEPGYGCSEAAASRKHLVGLRVVQRNLVYVIGIPPRISSESLLEGPDYFGSFGKLQKVALNKRHFGGGAVGVSPSYSVYVTFYRNEDAAACIAALDGALFDGRILRATYGTTKYCTYFLRCLPCQNPGCMYLHEPGPAADSYTVDQMANNKHNLHHTSDIPSTGTVKIAFAKCNNSIKSYETNNAKDEVEPSNTDIIESNASTTSTKRNVRNENSNYNSDSFWELPLPGSIPERDESQEYKDSDDELIKANNGPRFDPFNQRIFFDFYRNQLSTNTMSFPQPSAARNRKCSFNAEEGERVDLFESSESKRNLLPAIGSFQNLKSPENPRKQWNNEQPPRSASAYPVSNPIEHASFHYSLFDANVSSDKSLFSSPIVIRSHSTAPHHSQSTEQQPSSFSSCSSASEQLQWNDPAIMSVKTSTSPYPSSYSNRLQTTSTNLSSSSPTSTNSQTTTDFNSNKTPTRNNLISGNSTTYRTPPSKPHISSTQNANNINNVNNNSNTNNNGNSNNSFTKKVNYVAPKPQKTSTSSSYKSANLFSSLTNETPDIKSELESSGDYSSNLPHLYEFIDAKHVKSDEVISSALSNLMRETTSISSVATTELSSMNDLSSIEAELERSRRDVKHWESQLLAVIKKNITKEH